MAHSTTTVQRNSAGGHEPVARKPAESAPAHPMLAIQRTAGNQNVQRLLRSARVQAKLRVSQPGDKLEQEADRTAATVMRSSAPEQSQPAALGISRMAAEPHRKEANGVADTVHRSTRSPLREHPQPSARAESSRSPLREQPEASRHFDPGRSPLREHPQCCDVVQREANVGEHAMPMSASGSATAPSGFERRLTASKGGGQPMAPETRTQFEGRFGADFGAVRVHTGTESDHLNRDINARAFTAGNHIYFAAGQYNPDTPSGKTLLAHELTHVVQQGHADPIQRSTLHRSEADEPDDKPTPEQRAAALAAAARAQKAASAAAATGQREIVKSRQQEAKNLADEKQHAAKAAAHHAAKKKPPPKKPRIKHQEPHLAPLPEEAAGAAGGKKAPASAHDDPAFHAVVKRIVGVGRTQKKHEPGAKKADDAQAAAEQPKEERTGRAQDNQAGAIEHAQPAPFDAATLKSQLMKRIAELAPKTLSEADEFKQNNKLGGVKAEMGGKVAEQKTASAQPVKEKTDEAPDPKTVPEKPVVKIPDASPGGAPAGVGAAGAAPKPKTADEVEAPIQENTKRVGDEMASANVTEQQLAKSNEPSFQEALSSKKSAETQATKGAAAARASEHQQIKKAEAVAVASAASKTGAMHAGRAQSFGGVRTMQDATKDKDEAARRDVGQHIDGIYTKTKTEVDRILEALDGKVDKAFDEGAAAAKQAFEDYVDARMTAYKDDRYGGWFGWARWGKDKLLGMPDAVNAFYAEGRDLFLNKMDAVLDTVVAIIAADLTAAKAEVAKGRKEISDYLAGLPENLKKVGAEAAENANSMFDSLEDSVNNKAGQLVDSLANKYQESLKAIDARIEELKAANKGLVDKAIDAVKGVINAILELKDLLFRVLAKIAQVVMDIIADPIGFLKNMIAAIKLGLDNFIGRIGFHFKNAFITWLTGSLGSMSIQLPDDVFSVKGMFSLILQILGLSWDYVRSKAVKLLGEPVVKALEVGFTIFQILVKEGPAGLWEYAKEHFSDLKAMVIEKIEEMLMVEVIKAGIKWILGLLNPVSAFIKAAIAIYDIVSFFIQKAKQIMQLIEAIIDGIAEVVKGNIGGAAKFIEDALAKVLPIVIGFLANLLGIGGLADKVTGLFKSLRSRVDKFIDGIILKAKQWAGKLLGKLGAGTGPDERTPKEKEADLDSALAEAAKLAENPEEDVGALRDQLPAIQKKYRLKKLELDPEGDNKFDIVGEVNPTKKKQVKLAPLTVKTNVSFGSVESAGRGGTEMVANPLTPIHDKGSAPSSSPGVWDQVKPGVLKRDGVGLYVRGHLLNRLLGGKGSEENLTPISYEANATHERNVESDLKDIVNAPQKKDRKMVYYKVKVQPARGTPKPAAAKTVEQKLTTGLAWEWQEVEATGKATSPSLRRVGSLHKGVVPNDWPHV